MSKMALNEVGLTDGNFSEEATWAIYGRWELPEIIEEEACRLKQMVLKGDISLDDLRDGVTWANALDKEATELYGPDLSKGDQYVERAARRLMHLTGRSALEDLKNKRRRQNEIARLACKHTQNLVQ